MQRFFLDPARRLRLAICSFGKALTSQIAASLCFAQDDADGMLVTNEGEQAMIALTETTLQGRPMVAHFVHAFLCANNAATLAFPSGEGVNRMVDG